MACLRPGKCAQWGLQGSVITQLGEGLPLLPVLCSFTESLAEVTGLSSQLLRKDHIRVLPGRWKWSQEDRFPPIACVLATKFWHDELYKAVREPLKRPIPTPEVLIGGEFVTVETKRKRPPPAVPESAPTASQPTSQPPDLGTEPIPEDSEAGSHPAPSPKPSPSKDKEPPKEDESTKTGLIHVLGMKADGYFPGTLRDLSYHMVFIEVGDDDTDATSPVHSVVARLMYMAERFLVAVIGDRIRVHDVSQAIQKDIVRERLLVYPIYIFSPEAASAPYQFGQQELLIISRMAPKFKVCSPLCRL